ELPPRHGDFLLERNRQPLRRAGRCRCDRRDARRAREQVSDRHGRRLPAAATGARGVLVARVWLRWELSPERPQGADRAWGARRSGDGATPGGVRRERAETGASDDAEAKALPIARA